jgi:phosphate acetyltransferase
MSPETGTGKYEVLLERCRSFSPISTAVAHPCEETALEGAMEASRQGLIVPILVGPASKIRDVAARSRIDLGATQIVDAPHSHAAAAKAVEIVRRGEAASATPSSWTCRRTTRFSS